MPLPQRLMAIGLFALLVASCQSDGSMVGALDVASTENNVQTGSDGSSNAATRSFGSGPVRIGVLLPTSAGGVDGERARGMADAVLLAANDLGGGVVTVVLRDTAGSSGRSRAAATEEIGSRASVIVGPSDASGAAEVAAIKGDRRPPFLLLARGMAARNTYPMPLAESDSAVQGVLAVLRQGKQGVAILAADTAGGTEVDKAVSQAVTGAGGVIEARARFGASTDSLAAAVRSVREALTRPEIILVANDGQPVAPLAAALSAAGLLGKGVVLVGTSAWSRDDFASGKVDGATIATVDAAEMAPMAERFRAAYGRDPQLYEAYAYDAVALSAGLARAAGEKGLSAEVLTSPTGFRSTTGLFRLNPDGSVQRALALHRVAKGKLQRIGTAPTSF